MKKLIYALLLLYFTNAQALELNASSDRDAVFREEHTCLVTALFSSANPITSPENHLSAVNQCVRYGFGSMRYGAHFKRAYSTADLSPESPEGIRWLANYQKAALLWLAVSSPRCENLASPSACLVELGLN